MIKIYQEYSLGYCTNVHSGNELTEVFQNLENYLPLVQKALDRSEKKGIGLWLSAKASQELIQSKRAIELKSLAQTHQLPVISFNGFPYGNFHSDRVKREVYLPNWTDPRRLEYTFNLISLASQMGTPGQDYSISTLTVSFKSSLRDPSQAEKSAYFLGQAAAFSWKQERATGVLAHIDLEPEPLCFLEHSKEVVRYFKEHIWTTGASAFAQSIGIDKSTAQELLRSFIRICYDTCHTAIEFEEPDQVIDSYDRAGILIGKIQLSSAPSVLLTRGVNEQGETLNECFQTLPRDRYLHQVIVRTSEGSFHSFEDITEASAFTEIKKISGEARIHYHIPLFKDRFYGQGTTQDYVLKLLKLRLKKEICQTWEVETYTWDLLLSLAQPFQNLTRSETLALRIAAEINWVERHLEVNENECQGKTQSAS